jgi:hypothetical protein
MYELKSITFKSFANDVLGLIDELFNQTVSCRAIYMSNNPKKIYEVLESVATEIEGSFPVIEFEGGANIYNITMVSKNGMSGLRYKDGECQVSAYSHSNIFSKIDDLAERYDSRIYDTVVSTFMVEKEDRSLLFFEE